MRGRFRFCVCLFKQKTAYEMRISDWSSDVCSSDLTTTTNAPVGPPTWTREPPSAEMRNPAMTAVINPLSGVAPLAIAKAMARGRATIATVSPAMLSRRSRSNVYPSPRTVTSVGVNAVSRASYGFIFGLRFASLIVEHRWHAVRRTSRCGILQPDPAPGAVAGRILTDDLDSGGFQCIDHLHQRIDHAAHLPVRRLHSLDRRKRDVGQSSQLALVDTEKSTRRAHLL